MLVTQLFIYILSSSGDRERMANFVFGLNRVLIGKLSHPALDFLTAVGSRVKLLAMSDFLHLENCPSSILLHISRDVITVITAAFCSVHSKYGISSTYH